MELCRILRAGETCTVHLRLSPTLCALLGHKCGGWHSACLPPRRKPCHLKLSRTLRVGETACLPEHNPLLQRSPDHKPGPSHATGPLPSIHPPGIPSQCQQIGPAMPLTLTLSLGCIFSLHPQRLVPQFLHIWTPEPQPSALSATREETVLFGAAQNHRNGRNLHAP